MDGNIAEVIGIGTTDGSPLDGYVYTVFDVQNNICAGKAEAVQVECQISLALIRPDVDRTFSEVDIGEQRDGRAVGGCVECFLQ